MCIRCIYGISGREITIYRVGQNRIFTPYMTLFLVLSLPKYRIYTVYIWFWPTLCMHGISGRNITIYMVTCGAYIRSWQNLLSIVLCTSFIQHVTSYYFWTTVECESAPDPSFLPHWDSVFHFASNPLLRFGLDKENTSSMSWNPWIIQPLTFPHAQVAVYFITTPFLILFMIRSAWRRPLNYCIIIYNSFSQSVHGQVGMKKAFKLLYFLSFLFSSCSWSGRHEEGLQVAVLFVTTPFLILFMIRLAWRRPSNCFDFCYFSSHSVHDQVGMKRAFKLLYYYLQLLFSFCSRSGWHKEGLQIALIFVISLLILFAIRSAWRRPSTTPTRRPAAKAGRRQQAGLDPAAGKVRITHLIDLLSMLCKVRGQVQRWKAVGKVRNANEVGLCPKTT